MLFVCQISLPYFPIPKEIIKEKFGISWGGQGEYLDRLLMGFSPNIFPMIKNELKLTDAQLNDLLINIAQRFQLSIPYKFLPLQDCIDLSIFLIKTTIELQNFTTTSRGVGGAIDVAVITRTEGIQCVQQKIIMGEKT